MSVPLYFDHNIDIAILNGLRNRGIDVLSAREDGFDRADDRLLLARSSALKRLLFTNDTDFLRIAAEMQASSEAFSGIAFASQRGTVVSQIIDDLELIASALSLEDLENRVLFLPL
jgi:hypothetical protein